MTAARSTFFFLAARAAATPRPVFCVVGAKGSGWWLGAVPSSLMRVMMYTVAVAVFERFEA